MRVNFGCSVVLFWVCTASLGYAAPSADEILRKSDERRVPVGEYSFIVKVEDFKRKKRQSETTYRVYTKNAKRTRVETIKPARLSGRKLLMRDADLWLFLPDVKRPTRVSLQQRLTGEVSNGDIARTSFFEDYTPKFLGELVKDKIKTYKLELTARHADTTYRKIHLWVNKKTFNPIQADFFAISGKKLKSSSYADYRKVFGVPRASRVTIRDALTPTRYSQLRYSAFRRENLDESFFTKESLP